MGISFSIPCDPWVNKTSQWLDEKVDRIHNLEKNLTALETTMEELKDKKIDLSIRVIREEERGLQRLPKIQSLLWSYRYGKRVFLTLRMVEKLKSEVFEVIVEQAQTPEVELIQLQQRTIVGQVTMFEKAWKHLMEDEVGIMGMYGMGGVGKTTLLTQINNKFSENRCGFDFVIWVVVSKELQLEKIQDEIAQKVGIGGGEFNKRVRIYNFLRKKKIVLFLDDIWEKVDLADIGVPFPTRQNECKVAFTTRSQDVCARMRAEYSMEVQCLAENEAFDLFQKNVGHITLGSDPEILDLAKIVAKK